MGVLAHAFQDASISSRLSSGAPTRDPSPQPCLDQQADKHRCLRFWPIFFIRAPFPANPNLHLLSRPSRPNLSRAKHLLARTPGNTSSFTWGHLEREPALPSGLPGGCPWSLVPRAGLRSSHVGGRGGLGFLTCIPGTWTATGEWAMEATATSRCFCGSGALGSDWLLLQG